MTLTDTEKKEYKNYRYLNRLRAPYRLIDFIYYVKTDYRANWHHKYIANQLDNFVQSDRGRLMLFVPPQHGKSEITSRCLPAYLLGRNPNLKIAACSYSIDLARSFSRNVQANIDSEAFKEVFPGVEVGKPASTDLFKINDKDGRYKAVGVLGGLTGHTVDLAIIDDPVKDAMEANSDTYRNRVWEWYINVLETRLHNKSKVILIMTRWHEDDLAGRLLERQPGQWEVIKIPAIKEKGGPPDDPRKIGEPLWPDRHNLEKLNNLRALSERTFTSLYQQNPTVKEGDKIKKAWFQYCHEKELPERLTWNLWLDGAYTKSTANDPTGLMIAAYQERTRTLYIKHAHSAYMELPELLKFIPTYCDLHGLTPSGRAYIEPKASGKSLRQMLRNDPNCIVNPVEIKTHLVNEGKEARAQIAAPKIEAGRVVVVKGTWNDHFVNQLCGYPNAKHDEYIDLLGYAAYHHFDMKRNSKAKRRN